MTAFFAAILNIAASLLFFSALRYRLTQPADAEIMETIALWFALASIVLWIVFVGLFIARRRSRY